MKVVIKFKDPDVVYQIIRGAHPRSESKQEEFSNRFFEFGEHGRIEVDTSTLATQLLPRREWK